MDANKWQEKRQSIRSSYGWPDALINFQGTAIRGRARDISSGGALIHIKTKLEVGDQIGLTVNIRDIDDVMSATGTVMNVVVLDEGSSSPTYALGIRFTKMACWSSESVPF
ncbi:MAG: PilZ domain-containing protein [Desulfocapsa sp.]|nr:PilZ domain-containing protein [Desulfocapsa sp.]